MSTLVLTIGGNICTGKSTFARAVSNTLAWDHISNGSLSLEYLPSLFSDMSRWACETQLAFLVEKRAKLSAARAQNRNVVLERSLDEDVAVFARYFRNAGFIDARSGRLYDLIVKELGLDQIYGDAVIVCGATVATIKRRLQERERVIDRLYPAGHVEAISALYEEWDKASIPSAVFGLNSELFDWRDGAMAARLIDEVCRVFMRIADAHHAEGVRKPAQILDRTALVEQMLEPLNDRARQLTLFPP